MSKNIVLSRKELTNNFINKNVQSLNDRIILLQSTIDQQTQIIIDKDKKYSELENRYYATVQQNKILSYQEKSYYEHEGMEAFRHNNNRNWYKNRAHYNAAMEIDNKEKAKEIENVKATIVQVEQELEIASITEEQTTTNGADASIHRAHSANSVKYYAFFILLI
ncbi:15036_t:CDS:2 [Rhizophagus irregularis]|nr:15036_t:CDS:2 [Rhizophagus irregularis]